MAGLMMVSHTELWIAGHQEDVRTSGGRQDDGIVAYLDSWSAYMKMLI